MIADKKAALVEQSGHATQHNLLWVFWGSGGLRSGWSILLFLLLFLILLFATGSAASFVMKSWLHIKIEPASAVSTIYGEGLAVLSLWIAALLTAVVERRRVADYNLAGPRPWAHFAGGLAAGFLALSALVGGLAAGGWIHFGPVALSGSQAVQYAALWGVGFILVGFMEEGMFRCYFQFTLSRGINFWWALAILGAECASLAVRGKGNGAWGVYAVALLGLLPCLWLQLKQTPGSGFWQAAWVTSATFGFIHTGNGGENWIGIFAAAAIGFVFCVSVRVTGSAWWAIGCHAAWDWAETYFYGTADSGFVAKGHLFTSTPAGTVLWSGGTDGPEGSVLVLAAILLLLIAILAIYGRKSTPQAAAEAIVEPVAG